MPGFPSGSLAASKAVCALGEFDEFDGPVVVFHCLCEEPAVVDWHRVVLDRVDEESLRSVVGDLKFAGDAVRQLLGWVFSEEVGLGTHMCFGTHCDDGVDQDHVVWSRRLFFDRILVLDVSRVVVCS